MTKPKKKPKTGDVVGWAIIGCDGEPCRLMKTRADARTRLVYANLYGYDRPYRIAKIVLAK